VKYLLIVLLALTLSARENPFQDPLIKSSAAISKQTQKVDFKEIVLIFQDSSIEIITKDRLKEKLLLKNPAKIVLNFKRKINSATRSKELKITPFTKVRIGSHGSYYSIVIDLDRYRGFKVQQNSRGYKLQLK